MSRRSKVDAQLRERRAVQLKLAGKTFQEIADTEIDGTKLYGSAGAAHDAIMRVLNAEQEEYGRNVEELRTQELSRLDALYQNNFLRALKGDDKASNVCLRIMEQRRKYIGGLEVPQKIDTEIAADEKTLVALSMLAELKQSADDNND